MSNKTSEKRPLFKYLDRRRQMKTTKRFKNALLSAVLVVMLAMLAPLGATVGIGSAARAEAEAATLSAAPVVYWSTEADRATPHPWRTPGPPCRDRHVWCR